MSLVVETLRALSPQGISRREAEVIAEALRQEPTGQNRLAVIHSLANDCFVPEAKQRLVDALSGCPLAPVVARPSCNSGCAPVQQGPVCDGTPPPRPEVELAVFGRFVDPNVPISKDPFVLTLSRIEPGTKLLLLNRTAHPAAPSGPAWERAATSLPIDTARGGKLTAVFSDAEAGKLGVRAGDVLEVRAKDSAGNLSEPAVFAVNDAVNGPIKERLPSKVVQVHVRDNLASSLNRSQHSAEVSAKYRNHPMASSVIDGALKAYDVWVPQMRVSEWAEGYRLPALADAQLFGLMKQDVLGALIPSPDTNRAGLESCRLSASLCGGELTFAAANGIEPKAVVTVKNERTGQARAGVVGDDGSVRVALEASAGDPIQVTVADHSSAKSTDLSRVRQLSLRAGDPAPFAAT